MKVYSWPCQMQASKFQWTTGIRKKDLSDQQVNNRHQEVC